MSEEERNKDPFLFNRGVSELYTTVKNEILQKAAKPGNNLHSVKDRRNLNTGESEHVCLPFTVFFLTD